MSKYFSEYKLIEDINNNDTEHFLDDFKKFVFDNTNSKSREFIENSGMIIHFPKKKNDDKAEKSAFLVIHELSLTGAPIVMFDAAKILKKNGYFVTVMSMKSGPLIEDITNSGIPVIVNEKMNYLQHVANDSDLFCDISLVDFFVNTFDVNLFVTLCLYGLVRRYIGTENKIFWWIHEGKVSYKILGDRVPENISSNINVLCGGKYSLDHLKCYKKNYNATILNYGVVDMKKVDSKSKNENIVTFLLPATICERKGQNIMISALKDLPNEYMEKSKFIFVGDASDVDIGGVLIKKEILDFAKEHDNVRHIKTMPREELFKLYREIDVLVLASIDDPMPVVATENMIIENVCLCSNETGTSRLIEDGKNGFVFDVHDKNDLLKKIMYIIDHKSELKKIGQNGRKIYLNNFDIESFENRLLTVMGEI